MLRCPIGRGSRMIQGRSGSSLEGSSSNAASATRIRPATLCEGGLTSLVDDGANTVCDRFASDTTMIVSGALVIGAAIVWKLGPRARGRVLAGALVLSLPGYYALFAERADAPLRATTTAARLDRVETSLEDDARTRGCASEENPCEACQPITRFAHARRGVCADASVASWRGDAGARCEAENLGCLPP